MRRLAAAIAICCVEVRVVSVCVVMDVPVSLGVSLWEAMGPVADSSCVMVWAS